MLVAALSIAMLLVIWFKTDAFVEYVRLFGLSKRFELVEFEKLKSGDPSFTYVDFIVNYWSDNFFTRLITCPICLATWLGIFVGILTTSFLIILPSAFLGLFLYTIWAKL